MIPKDDQYALLGVNLIDGDSYELKRKMAIKVKNGHFYSIENLKNYQREEGMKEVDLDGLYLMPGMIDAHVHLAGIRANADEQELGGILEHEYIRAMRSISEAQSLLKYGFTAVRDISWNGLYLKRLFNEKTLIGPRIVACGPGICRTGGHADLYQLPLDFVARHHYWSLLCDGPEEIRKGVRRLLREGADQIKVVASGGDNHETDRNADLHYSMEEIKMAVAEAKMIKGTMVCIHCENLESARLSVEAGADTIEHGEELDEALAEKMAKKGVILVPTLELLLYWYETFKPVPAEKTRADIFFHRTLPLSIDVAEKSREKIIANIKMAREKGVKVALGSDCVFEPITPYGFYSAKELQALAFCGMNNIEAIKAATKTAAEALGLSHMIGTIETGKCADYLLLEEDPFINLELFLTKEKIRCVVLDGRLVAEKGILIS